MFLVAHKTLKKTLCASVIGNRNAIVFAGEAFIAIYSTIDGKELVNLKLNKSAKIHRIEVTSDLRFAICIVQFALEEWIMFQKLIEDKFYYHPLIVDMHTRETWPIHKPQDEDVRAFERFEVFGTEEDEFDYDMAILEMQISPDDRWIICEYRHAYLAYELSTGMRITIEENQENTLPNSDFVVLLADNKITFIEAKKSMIRDTSVFKFNNNSVDQAPKLSFKANKLFMSTPNESVHIFSADYEIVTANIIQQPLTFVISDTSGQIHFLRPMSMDCSNCTPIFS